MLNEIVVLFVAADPDPFDSIARELTDRTVMIPYANGEAITSATFELLKIE